MTAPCPTSQPAAGEGGGAARSAPGEPAQVTLWVKAAQKGDQKAMESLIEHFQDRVWHRARYRLKDHDEAWDVAQEVFIICLRKIRQFRGRSQFWTWLVRIVDNQVKNRQNWWRRRRRAQTFSLHELYQGQDEQEETAWDPPDGGPSPRQLAAAREEVESLERAMGQLTEDHREVLMLRFADGQSYEEIAQTLLVSIGTVKSRINRARRDLRAKMDR